MVVALRPAVASLALTTLSTVLGPKPAVSIGDGIEIRLSGSKGRGAFATRDLAEGTFLGRYTGKLMDEAQALAAYQNGDSSGSYFATIEKGPFGGTPLVVDAEDDRIAGWPRFINHSKRKANCKNAEIFRPFNVPGEFDLGKAPLGLYVQAMRDIREGEELLIDYGEAYWTSRGFPPTDPRRFVIDYL